MKRKATRRGTRETGAQLTLDSARRPTGRGGWRPGAGRPRGRTTLPHEPREDFTGREPLHVTLRVVEGVPSLRRHGALRIVQRAIADSGHREDFRVVEYALLSNHLHLAVEAEGRQSLGIGMHDLEVRLSLRLNRFFERNGPFFADRYHARVLRSPRDVRNTLRYLLDNQRQHEARRGVKLSRDWIDPFSSAYWFDGWREPVRLREPRQRSLLACPRPTALARSWLLKEGWRRGGLLAFDEEVADLADSKSK